MKIVISGVNIVSGGMLTIYQECLRELSMYNKNIEIIALVHSKSLFKDLQFDNIEYMEYPNAKKSWFVRCYYEYYFFYKLSQKIKPDMWLSIHDMSPIVQVPCQYVYCHNSSPFYDLKLSELCDDWRFSLFCIFYKYIYQINIKSNTLIIVQQEWLRKKFHDMYGLDNIIVSRPRSLSVKRKKYRIIRKCKKLIYPVTAHTYKNILLLCKVGKKLADLDIDIKIFITVNGTEGKYIKKLVEQYGMLPTLEFIGLQPKHALLKLYEECDAMVFPSRLESWGLPLSEFEDTGKPIIVSDLAYAHEVLDGYEAVSYADPLNVDEWTEKILKLFKNKLTFDKNEAIVLNDRFASNWSELFKMLGISSGK